MNKKRKVVLSVIIVVIAVVIIIAINSDDVTNYSAKYAGVDLTSDVDGVSKENTYTQYLEQHKDVNKPTTDVEVDIFSYDQGEDVQVMTDYEGEAKVLYTGDSSSVQWSVNVEQSGLYNMYLEYYTIESRGVDIEREIYINGKVPFSGADTLTFSRLWTNNGAVKQDNRGNEIRPSQVESYEWQNAYFKDTLGYIVEPYQFYFEQGVNTITLKAVNEPAVLRKLVIKAIEPEKAYEEYRAEQPVVTMSDDAMNYEEIIQGEDSTVRSDASLYPKYDRSSPATVPYSITKTILNYIGGETWKTAGQWIEWDFTVPEDGYYNISIKGRQNYQRGSISCRTLYIDGITPFSEVQSIEFGYSNKWDTMTLSDGEGSPYEFYLEKGTHTIRLEVTLGEVGEILERLNDSVFTMNNMYRKVLVLTGATPDKYRDYDIQFVYPEVIEAMKLESLRLYKIVDDFVAYSGQKSDKIATAQTLATQLEKYGRRPAKIAKTLVDFKINLSSLGTSIQSMSESKLDIDYIVVSGSKTNVAVKEETFLARTVHEVKSFFSSFFVDYNSLGDVYDEDSDDVITVWIASGRDQSSILKAMVDDTFIPLTGVKANIELVAADALLNAVIAGNGPDVAVTIMSDQPINYALRNAAEDLTQFEGYEEVLENFYPSAYRPFEYDGGIYALPETQSYNVMFYRKDILIEDLGLSIPQTWDDLIGMLPTIQGNNMSVAIPTTERIINGAQSPDLSMLFSLVYQNDGQIYDDDAMTTVIDEEAGVKAFETYTSLFNDYGMPTLYDFPSRFRSGEMPLGIADFATYNTLAVSAPEIKGLWDFALLPGTEITDEAGNTYIDRSTHSWGNACMMIASDNDAKKQSAWEFMKWWVSTETQVRFGREIESILGSSARYPTANKEAFLQLPWSADQVEVLSEQWKWGVGFREIAGGYYTSRHITNAARKVINKKEDPRETLLDYARTINEEITKKRKEFGLPVK